MSTTTNPPREKKSSIPDIRRNSQNIIEKYYQFIDSFDQKEMMNTSYYDAQKQRFRTHVLGMVQSRAEKIAKSLKIKNKSVIRAHNSRRNSIVNTEPSAGIQKYNFLDDRVLFNNLN